MEGHAQESSIRRSEIRDLAWAGLAVGSRVQDAKLCMGFMMPGFNVDDDCPKEGAQQGSFLLFHSR